MKFASIVVSYGSGPQYTYGPFDTASDAKAFVEKKLSGQEERGEITVTRKELSWIALFPCGTELVYTLCHNVGKGE